VSGCIIARRWVWIARASDGFRSSQQGTSAPACESSSQQLRPSASAIAWSDYRRCSEPIAAKDAIYNVDGTTILSHNFAQMSTEGVFTRLGRGGCLQDQCTTIIFHPQTCSTIADSLLCSVLRCPRIVFRWHLIVGSDIGLLCGDRTDF